VATGTADRALVAGRALAVASRAVLRVGVAGRLFFGRIAICRRVLGSGGTLERFRCRALRTVRDDTAGEMSSSGARRVAGAVVFRGSLGPSIARLHFVDAELMLATRMCSSEFDALSVDAGLGHRAALGATRGGAGVCRSGSRRLAAGGARLFAGLARARPALRWRWRLLTSLSLHARTRRHAPALGGRDALLTRVARLLQERTAPAGAARHRFHAADGLAAIRSALRPSRPGERVAAAAEGEPVAPNGADAVRRPSRIESRCAVSRRSRVANSVVVARAFAHRRAAARRHVSRRGSGVGNAATTLAMLAPV
jgi:hypothetical protein